MSYLENAQFCGQIATKILYLEVCLTKALVCMQRFDTGACIEIKYCRWGFSVVLYAVIWRPISSLLSRCIVCSCLPSNKAHLPLAAPNTNTNTNTNTNSNTNDNTNTNTQKLYCVQRSSHKQGRPAASARS